MATMLLADARLSAVAPERRVRDLGDHLCRDDRRRCLRGDD
jgi:hypothetical protein